MLGNYLQQTTSAEVMFQMHFFLGALRVNIVLKMFPELYVKIGIIEILLICLFRVEHQRLHEKHKGHEAMHAEMVLILIVTLVVAQIILVQWKQRFFRSYQVCT